MLAVFNLPSPRLFTREIERRQCAECCEQILACCVYPHVGADVSEAILFIYQSIAQSSASYFCDVPLGVFHNLIRRLALSVKGNEMACCDWFKTFDGICKINHRHCRVTSV